MDNETGSYQPVGRRIALGLADFIADFANRLTAETWEEFARDVMLNWRLILLELADDPATMIFFNLYQVDVQVGLTRVASGRATPTDWELLQIHEHRSWWPRIGWWDREDRMSNPFDRGTEP